MKGSRMVRGFPARVACVAWASLALMVSMSLSAHEDGAHEVLDRDAKTSGPTPTREQGLEAFEKVRVVLQHPRCQNCHIPGDAPLQFDEGTVHQQNVKRGPDGHGAAGLACATCHASENPPTSYGAHQPPGAPNWALPPPEHKMVFIELESGPLCRGLKDEEENGGKDLAALIEHVAKDGLVLWGWDPGVGREPVDTPHAEFVAAFKTWAAAGAPCADD